MPMRHPYFDLHLPIILGHRGAAGEMPENTLLSFATGLELGAQILESDVHVTRDGIPVLAHDADVDRVTEGTGAIASLDLADLQRLDAGYRFSPDEGKSFPYRGRGLVIPTLEQTFNAQSSARFNLELKTGAHDLPTRVLTLCREHAREHRTLVTSGSDEVMTDLRSAIARDGSQVAIGASTADILAFVRSALAGDAPKSDSMALQIPVEFAGRPLITHELIRHAHAHGAQIHAWTINEPAEIERLLDLGVDGIVTDHPGRMASLVAERRARG